MGVSKRKTPRIVGERRNPRNGLTAEGMNRLRERLATNKAISTINKAAGGEIEISTSRYKACELILRKSLPDLSSVDTSHHHDGTVQFIWGPAEPMKTIEHAPQPSPATIIDATLPKEPEGKEGHTATPQDDTE